MIDYKNLINKKCNSQEELENLLKENNLIMYVKYKEDLFEMIDKYPIFNKFSKQINCIDFSSKLINEYLGEDLFPEKSDLSSLNFNILLNRVLEKAFKELKYED